MSQVKNILNSLSKKYIFLIATFIFITAFCHSQKLNGIYQQKLGEKYFSYQSPFKYLEKKEQSYSDFIYHRFNLEIDPTIREIKGSVTTYFKSQQDNLSFIVFDLSDSLSVDSVFSGGSPANFNHTESQLLINLDATLNIGKVDSVTVYYHGIPTDGGGFGSFVQAYHDNYPIIWTLSEPYGAKDWWPCKQDLTDKIDSLDIFVTTPYLNKVAANGVLISVKQSNGNSIYYWKHRHPIAAYLIGVAVTNYAEYTEYATLPDGDSLAVLNYVFPESLQKFKENTPKLLEVITFFSERFIPYPFRNEKYGQAQFLWGGGMEHQTMSFIGSPGYTLMVHELAHQWFGNYITCASWQELWLNEGFATYLAGLAKEKFLPDEWIDFKRSEINKITEQPDGSIFRADTQDIGSLFSNRLTYVKGGMVLHMLRHELGDDNFFSGLKRYLNDTTIMNGFAHTADLKRNLEYAADTNLDEFFNDWYIGQGFPTYELYWQQNRDLTVNLSIKQTQSDPSVSFFEMHLPVFFEGISTDTTIMVYNSQNNEEYILNPGFEILRMELDPEYNIVKGRTLIMRSGFRFDIDEYSVYPNPANNLISVKALKDGFIERIEVFNLSGMLVDTLNYSPGSKSVTINAQEYARGIYVMKVIDAQKYFIKKILLN